MKAYFTNVHLLVHYISVHRFLLLFLFMIQWQQLGLNSIVVIATCYALDSLGIESQ